MEQLKELNKMLVAKEFQIRMEGITLLMEHCTNSLQLVLSNIIQVWRIFSCHPSTVNIGYLFSEACFGLPSTLKLFWRKPPYQVTAPRLSCSYEQRKTEVPLAQNAALFTKKSTRTMVDLLFIPFFSSHWGTQNGFTKSFFPAPFFPHKSLMR